MENAMRANTRKQFTFRTIWKALREDRKYLRELSAEADKRAAETDRLFKERAAEADKRTAETDRLFKERAAETDRLFKERAAETDRLFKERAAETDRLFKERAAEADKRAAETWTSPHPVDNVKRPSPSQTHPALHSQAPNAP